MRQRRPSSRRPCEGQLSQRVTVGRPGCGKQKHATTHHRTQHPASSIRTPQTRHLGSPSHPRAKQGKRASPQFSTLSISVWGSDLIYPHSAAKGWHRGAENQSSPLEFTCTTKSLSALLFWGCSRQFTRKTCFRLHCSRSVLTLLQYLVAVATLDSGWSVTLPGFYVQPGASLSADGTANYTVPAQGGHLKLDLFWHSIPEAERSDDNT